MSEEYRIEHRAHMFYIAGCPYCLKRAHDAGESPEPLVVTDQGVFCLIHGAYDCAEPFCWRCGNHQIQERRCTVPSCHATVDADVVALVAEIGPDAPVELLAYEIGRMLSRGWHLVGSEEGSAPALPPSQKEK